jgi:hypothetical protein
MCLVACRAEQNGNYIDGDIRRIDVLNGEVARTTGVIGYGRNARFSPDGKLFASLAWDTRTVTIATINGGSIRSFKVEEPGVLSWTQSGIWIGSLHTIALYDTTGAKRSERNFQWCNRAFVSRNEKIAGGVWEGDWFGALYDFESGATVRLEGWPELLNCSVCPNPSGTMVTNNLYPSESENDQHTTMRLCDLDGKGVQTIRLHEITDLPNGYFWNTQCWSGNSNDWLALPIGQSTGAFPVNDKNTSPWIYNIATDKALCLADRQNDFWQPYDYYAGYAPVTGTAVLQLSNSELAFYADSGVNPLTKTLDVSTPFGNLEQLAVLHAPGWLRTSFTTSEKSTAIAVRPDCGLFAPGAYIDSLLVTTANAGTQTCRIVLHIARAGSAAGIHSLIVSPPSGTIRAGSALSFIATPYGPGEKIVRADSIAWTVSGGGRIDDNGLFIAGKEFGGPHSVCARVYRGDAVTETCARVMISHSSSLHMRVNCGPDTLSDPGWESDNSYVSGGFDRKETGLFTLAGVGGAAPSVIYRGVRTGNPHSYRIPGLAPGPYTVRMHFIDISGATRRYMNYAIGSESVFEAFDIHEYTGAFAKAAVIDFQTNLRENVDMLIEASASAGEVFEAGFEIIRAEARPFVLIEPCGNETYAAGGEMSVRWCADTAVVRMVTAELSLDNGKQWSQITTSKGVDIASKSWGNLVWKIPDSLRIGDAMVPATSEACRVRISSYFQTGIYAVSRDTFRIVDPSGVNKPSDGALRPRSPVSHLQNGVLIDPAGASILRIYKPNGALLAEAGSGSPVFIETSRLSSGVYFIEIRGKKSVKRIPTLIE